MARAECGEARLARRAQRVPRLFGLQEVEQHGFVTIHVQCARVQARDRAYAARQGAQSLACETLQADASPSGMR